MLRNIFDFSHGYSCASESGWLDILTFFCSLFFSLSIPSQDETDSCGQLTVICEKPGHLVRYEDKEKRVSIKKIKK
jgi:hypothetical protein